MMRLSYNDSFSLTNQKHLTRSFDQAYIDECNDENYHSKKGNWRSIVSSTLVSCIRKSDA